MKITTTARELAAALRFTAPAVRRLGAPVYAGVLLAVSHSEQSLTVIATAADREITAVTATAVVSVDVPAGGASSAVALVSHGDLIRSLKALPAAAKVTLEFGPTHLSVAAVGGRFRQDIEIMETDQYPALSDLTYRSAPDVGYCFAPGALQRAVSTVAPAAGKPTMGGFGRGEKLEVFTGIIFDTRTPSGTLHLITTDRYQAAVWDTGTAPEPANGSQNACGVPRSVPVAPLAVALKMFDPAAQVTVEFNDTDATAYIAAADGSRAIRLRQITQHGPDQRGAPDIIALLPHFSPQSNAAALVVDARLAVDTLTALSKAAKVERVAPAVDLTVFGDGSSVALSVVDGPTDALLLADAITVDPPAVRRHNLTMLTGLCGPKRTASAPAATVSITAPLEHTDKPSVITRSDAPELRALLMPIRR